LLPLRFQRGSTRRNSDKDAFEESPNRPRPT
jgi:hypothetical protein